MQQRYYDPQVGRFLSVDPMASDTDNGWNFNRYNYAANNPYKFTDPDGRFINFIIGAGIGAGIDIVAQKIANPSADINWTSVGVSAAVGAATSGIGSIYAAAANRGAITVASAVSRTAIVGGGIAATGSAVDSGLNGETPSATKMVLAAGLAGAGSKVAGSILNKSAITAQQMSKAMPNTPAGIGATVTATTQAATGTTSAAVNGATSTAGRLLNISSQTGTSAAQKKIEEKVQ